MGSRAPRLWLLLLAALGEGGSRQAGAERFIIYWNASNPRLQRDDFSLTVNINDYLDVYCPHYGAPASDWLAEERYDLYMVDAEGYARCDTAGGFVRWRCDRPEAPASALRFSEKFQLFTPFSAGFEFRAGRDYFYVSLSATSKDKSINHHNNSNSHKCLRLRVSVCCATTTRTTTTIPSTPPPQPNQHPRNREDGAAERGSPAHQTGAAARRGHAPRPPQLAGVLAIAGPIAVLLMAS